MISVKNICKTYTQKDVTTIALDDVSLDIQEGEIFGVIGYSGAGKSTFVRCLNLLETPDSGEISINGKVIYKNKDSEKIISPVSQIIDTRRHIGMIFQHFNLFDRYNVYDNIAFPLVNAHVDKRTIESKVNNLLQLVNLSDKAKSYPCELSGGQKQRVAIARALANDPKVLLSDEATSALDPEATEQILTLLHDLNKKLGLTIIVITHEMQVIKSICSKVAVMENGRVVESGSVYDIFASPKEDITKKFILSSSPLKYIDKIKNNSKESFDLSKNKQIIKLTFDDRSVGSALISEISRKYNANVNIMLANIEIIEDKPLGNLVAKIESDINIYKDIVGFLKENKVKVEEL